MRIGGCDLCESVAAMMRILSQGRSLLHYGVFVATLVATSAQSDACVGPNRSDAVGELHSTFNCSTRSTRGGCS